MHTVATATVPERRTTREARYSDADLYTATVSVGHSEREKQGRVYELGEGFNRKPTITPLSALTNEIYDSQND